MIRTTALVFLLTLSAALVPASASAGGAGGAPQNPPPATGAGAGKEILQRKCFQCHQASMWTSLRQDRKAWEGVLYRMVGRGALWTEDEIRAMADFLGQTRGPK
jgi:cytochrome c5